MNPIPILELSDDSAWNVCALGGGRLLGVCLQPGEAIFGPVSLPGRAGCWACADARMRAAGWAPRAGDTAASLELAQALLDELVSDDASTLLDHVLIVDTHSCTSSLHRVVPMPECAVCGGALAHPRREAPATGTAMEQLAGLLDFRTGLVSRLQLESESEIPLVATAAPPRLRLPDGSLRTLPAGWGKGLDLDAALFSTVGEAMERYGPSLPERVCCAREQDLDAPVLNVHPVYSDAQYARPDFPYARYERGSVQPWVRGAWLPSGAPVWLPAISAYLSMTVEPGQYLSQGTSNGLAAHTDRDEATLRAVLELVERDAFLAAWMTGRAGTRIVIDDSLEPGLRAVLAALGTTVELYRLETAACGTAVLALALALGDGRSYPGATMALGADLDARQAVRQAILELGQTGPYLRRMMRARKLVAPRRASEVREMTDHAAWFFRVSRARAFDRLRGSDTVALRALPRRRRSLAACVRALTDVGVRVAVADVTSSDLATRGWWVMRAMSPDLQPLWYGHGLERPPVARVHSMGVRRRWGVHPVW